MRQIMERKPVRAGLLRMKSRLAISLHPGNLPCTASESARATARAGETMIRIKSIHDSVSDEDAFRVFVEPAWPRGVSREKADLDIWLRDLAPSPGLFERYSSEGLGWEDFVSGYHRELERNLDFFPDLQDHDRNGGLTLVHGSRNKEQNTAVALRMRLERFDPAQYRKDDR